MIPSIVTTLNIPLKIAILASGRGQYEVAKLSKIDDGRLSKIVNGHLPPTESERLRLAGVLQKSLEELFPEVTAQ